MAETLAEILKEGKRLEADLYHVEREEDVRRIAESADALLWYWRKRGGPALLAVAKAAVEHVDAKERFINRPSGGDEIEWYRTLDAMDDTYAALLAAVRGADEGGNDGR